MTDSDGYPIQDVAIFVDMDTPKGRSTDYTDENGIATLDFAKLGLGRHSAEIREDYKIKKRVLHEINVEALPAEITLIWDYGNPADMVYVPRATATLRFLDEDGNAIKGLPGGTMVYAAYLRDDNKDGLGIDSFDEVGTLDENGVVVWNNPPIDAEVEFQVDKDEQARTTYTVTVSGADGNTDYYLQW